MSTMTVAKRLTSLSARRNLAEMPLKGQDKILLDLIVRRAARLLPSVRPIQIEMDLVAVHRVVQPLWLRELLVAPEEDFLHDITGIMQHLDRETVTLTGHFVPRYAR